MVNTLTTIRSDIKDALSAAGMKAIEYVNENLVPPVCVVVPASPYITLPEGQNPYGAPYSVNINVLIVGGKATNATAATQIDSMIINVVDTLDENWDITEVTAPQEMSLKGIAYIGAVVTLQINTKLEKEVI